MYKVFRFFVAVYFCQLIQLARNENNFKITSSFVLDNDDWVEQHVNDSFHAPLTNQDYMWNYSSRTFDTNSISINPRRSISVSIFAPKILEIFVNTDHESRRYKLPITDDDVNDAWKHYGVYLFNNKLLIYEGERTNLIAIINGVEKENNIFMSVGNITQWKIHNYTFRTCDRVSKNRPTILKISSNEKSTIVLYTSMCYKCYLELELKNEKESTRTIIKNSVDNTQTMIKVWHEYVIDEQVREIKIYRKNNKTSDESGYWEIVIIEIDSSDGKLFATGISLAIIVVAIVVLIIIFFWVAMVKIQKIKKIKKNPCFMDEMSSRRQLLQV